MKITGLIIIFCSLFLSHSLAQELLPAGYQYVFPRPGAKYVHPNSTIILRVKNISPKDLTNFNTCIKVSGEESGTHSGNTIIASDKRTIIFTPEKSYKIGEKVYVTIEPRLTEFTSITIQPLNYEFTVLEQEVIKGSIVDEKSGNLTALKNAVIVEPQIMSNGVSVPSDFPHVNITHNNNPSSDYIFLNTMIPPFYNIIFNTLGDPVWYRKTSDLREDFRVQANGWITMQIREGYGESDLGHIAFTENFEFIKSFHATNGYATDEHEFYMLPDSGYFLIGKRDTKVDMSQYVAGGLTDAIVTETCIQEFTADDQLIFIWRAWDHFNIRDVELEVLTSSRIRFPHMNAIFTDDDGHILLSSRNLSEISKIHRQSGEFIWRMSGIPDSPNNDFQFVGDPLNGFRNQHAIRSLGNNRYTLLDNGNSHSPPVSRAVEYIVDTVQMTATLVWEYRNDVNNRIARFMGNTQRLPNGNTHINWAVGNYPTIALEVTPDGNKVFEMHFENGANCYRSFRHPWVGKCPVPYLLLEPQIDNLTLIFNKFGDDNVDYYNIYGGPTPNPSTLIDTSHNILKQLVGLQNGSHYYFRVTAVDMSGLESDFSNEENIYVNITQPGNNLIINGDFTNALFAWEWEVDSLASAEVLLAEGVCNFVIQNGGLYYKDIQLNQDSILLIQGQSYIFEFDAWADEARVVEIKFTGEDPQFTDYSRIGYTALTSTKQQFAYSFEMQESTNNNARVVINTGASDKNMYMDNLSLKIDALSTSAVRLQEEIKFLLSPNYPNPFRQSTTINYTIPIQCHVRLIVFDGLGRVVEVLVDKVQSRGSFKTKFDASELDYGVYYYKMTAGGFMKTRKMLLLR